MILTAYRWIDKRLEIPEKCIQLFNMTRDSCDFEKFDMEDVRKKSNFSNKIKQTTKSGFLLL